MAEQRLYCVIEVNTARLKLGANGVVNTGGSFDTELFMPEIQRKF